MLRRLARFRTSIQALEQQGYESSWRQNLPPLGCWRRPRLCPRLSGRVGSIEVVFHVGKSGNGRVAIQARFWLGWDSFRNDGWPTFAFSAKVGVTVASSLGFCFGSPLGWARSQGTKTGQGSAETFQGQIRINPRNILPASVVPTLPTPKGGAASFVLPQKWASRHLERWSKRLFNQMEGGGSSGAPRQRPRRVGLGSET